jgi:hypothetical protein
VSSGTDSSPIMGRVCRCAAGMGPRCVMISCSGCCEDGDTADSGGCTEMVLVTLDMGNYLPSLCREIESLPLPGTVYLEVPVKPPNKFQDLL